jgi:hypothetical protein
MPPSINAVHENVSSNLTQSPIVELTAKLSTLRPRLMIAIHSTKVIPKLPLTRFQIIFYLDNSGR